MFRRIHLYRHEDISGCSGTGVVATGVKLGPICILRWRAGLIGHSTVTIYPSLQAIVAIHGHDGRTQLV